MSGFPPATGLTDAILNQRRHSGFTTRDKHREAMMYLARFCYDVAPTNRERALDCIRQEAEAARKRGLTARVLVPLTRAHGGAALQFEIEPRST